MVTSVSTPGTNASIREAALGVGGDRLAKDACEASGPIRVESSDAERGPRPRQAIVVDEPSLDEADGDELDLQRRGGFQVFILEHGRPDQLAGLVREDQQPRVARLQTPDLEGIGVERPGSPRPRPVAGTEAVSIGADDGQPVRADEPARAAQAAGQLEVHSHRSRAGRDVDESIGVIADEFVCKYVGSRIGFRSSAFRWAAR